MKFTYQVMPDWPPLAWIARCEPGLETVLITHGPNVEVIDDWFCEAVWDGEFNEGGFDNTDIVAGSGGRKRTDKILFVSAGNTVDRLVSIKLPEAIFVSNSLACLAAMTGLDFLLSHDWVAAFRSVAKGINRYQSTLPSSRGDVQLTYFYNLIWNGQNLIQIEKPLFHRDFSSFELYRDFLLGTLRRIFANGNSRYRRHPFNPLATISTGYDSPTVTALAKTINPEIEGFTFNKTLGTSKDDGSEIARYLQVDLHLIDIDQWQDTLFPEVPILTADGMGTEICYMGAKSILNARILLTGFHGDVVWGKNIEGASEQFIRIDQAGLSLSEYRLWANFIHCPIPFWGARQSADIIHLSNSESMREWDVSGDYSRPICRRIVESAGVPRELFGREKKGAAVSFYSNKEFLTTRSMRSYLQWLQLHRSKVVTGLFSKMVTNLTVDRALFRIFKSAQRIAGRISSLGHSIAALDWVRKPFLWLIHVDWANNSAPPWILPLRRFMFPWAIEMAKKKYAINSDQLQHTDNNSPR